MTAFQDESTTSAEISNGNNREQHKLNWKRIVFIALATALSIIILFGLWAGWTRWKNSQPEPYGVIHLPDSYEPATFVSEDTVSQIWPLIDQAKTLGDLEKVVDKEFMSKEYGRVGKDKRDSKIFLSQNTTNQALKKSNQTLNLDKYKFDYPQEKDLEKTKLAVKIFISEITKYPKQFSGFAFEFYFVFVKNIVTPNGEAAGFYGDFVYFDINQIGINDDYSRLVVNHEFAHQLDHVHYLIQSTQATNQDYNTGIDPIWAALNDPKFQYSKQPLVDDGIFHPNPGFVTNYAKSNTLEDKAEVLSFLMTQFKSSQLQEILSQDSILKKKVDYLLDALDEKAPGFKKVVNERANLR